jgi:hypothetical protein
VVDYNGLNHDTSGVQVSHGRVCGYLSVSRAFGDIQLKTQKQQLGVVTFVVTWHCSDILLWLDRMILTIFLGDERAWALHWSELELT